MTLNPKYLRGCVLAFDFAELSGSTVYDLSGNGNHGTIYGASWSKGPLIGSLYFDGENDYVEVPHSDSLNLVEECSLEVLVYSENYAVGDYQTFVTKHAEVYGLRVRGSGEAEFVLYTDPSGWHILGSPNPLENGKWHLITGTYSKSQGIAELYINSELVRTAERSENIVTNTRNLYLGSRYGSDRFFNGYIAFVRIYNRVLSEKEIREHYYYVKNMLSKPRFPIFYKHKRTSIVPALA